MGMGGNGNGNGFMGMGGNGNRNSPSRTPLLTIQLFSTDSSLWIVAGVAKDASNNCVFACIQCYRY